MLSTYLERTYQRAAWNDENIFSNVAKGVLISLALFSPTSSM